MEPIEDDSGEDQLPSAPAPDGESDNALVAFGRAIRARREAAGLTQERAAQRIQISLRNLIRAEKGGNQTVRMFFKIIRGLNLGPFEFGGYVIGAKEEVSLMKGKKRSRVPPIKRNEFPLRSNSESNPVQAVEVSRRDPKTTPVRLHAEIRDRRIVALGDGEVVMLPEDVPQGGTIQVRVSGEDFRSAGIGDGDVLTVAVCGEAVTPKPGSLVMAIVSEEIVIGKYHAENGARRIDVGDGTSKVLAEADRIYGVITTLVRQFDSSSNTNPSR